MAPRSGRRPGPHPGPPRDLHTQALPVVEQPGPWFRIHQARYGAIYFGRSGDNRFDDPVGEFGVLYAGVDLHAAFIETLGQVIPPRRGGPVRVSEGDLMVRRLSLVVAGRPLRLVKVCGGGGLRLTDGRLCTGNHGPAQRWSRALVEHPQTFEGILYYARHDLDRLSVALFDRTAGLLSERPLGDTLLDLEGWPPWDELLEYYQVAIVPS